jgi:flagellar hook assembly protein FlgD
LFETDDLRVPPLPVTLYQNHPNPFNPSTVIRFYLPEAQEVSLDVYDIAGELVVKLAEGRREKGFHALTWNGRNSSSAMCASGVYFSRLKAGKDTISRKMVIMR